MPLFVTCPDFTSKRGNSMAEKKLYHFSAVAIYFLKSHPHYWSFFHFDHWCFLNQQAAASGVHHLGTVGFVGWHWKEKGGSDTQKPRWFQTDISHEKCTQASCTRIETTTEQQYKQCWFQLRWNILWTCLTPRAQRQYPPVTLAML